MENTREIVYEMLLYVYKVQMPSHVVLQKSLTKYAYLEKRDRALISRLFRGVLENKIKLDYVIGRYSSVKFSRIKKPLRIILEMGIYQILMMEHIPDSAACNEAVKLAKKHGFSSLSGFVNGVLRGISREKGNISWPDRKDTVRYLSVMYSLPEWIVRRWIKVYGAEKTEDFGRFFLQEQPVTLRIRDLSRREALVRELQESGVTVLPGQIFENAVRIAGFGRLEDLPSFAAGAFAVQDESSMMTVAAAGLQGNEQIIDVCAAPGGKSLQAADLLTGGRVIARDKSEEKAELIRSSIRRTGAQHIETQVCDARVLQPQDAGRADVVIADLPCSGLGVIGRKPDIRYVMTPEETESLVRLQKEILQTVSQYVKPGGLMIYSTCTVNAAENQEMVRWMTEAMPFKAESMDPYLPACLHNGETAQGMRQILPGEFGTDGFFAARLRRME